MKHETGKHDQVQSSETLIQIAMIRLLLARQGKKN
jgi:hypothetical protein